jgi:azobenzene reductase
MKAVFITGSMRSSSYSNGLCYSIASVLERYGYDPIVFDQRLQPLPLCDAIWHHEPERHPDQNVQRLVKLVDEAKAIVICSPVYHNGPSGLVKNALDFLAIKHFAHKPVGLISHGGNRTSQAVDQMRIWTRGLLGHAIAVQVCTQASDYTLPAGGGDPEISNPDITARIERFCNELNILARSFAITYQALCNR